MPYGQEQHYEIAIQSPAMYFTRAGVTFILLMIAGYVVASYWADFTVTQLALNPTGVFCWKRFDGNHALPDIVAELREVCNDVPVEAEQNIEAFSAELAAKGLIGYEVGKA